MEMKIKSKKYMVKLENLLVGNDEEWLLCGQEPLPFYIWETFQINCLVYVPNLSIGTEGRYICAYFMIFSLVQK